MRYRTAGILSATLVVVNVGMFSLRAAVWAVFLPLEQAAQGVEPPTYEKILLVAADFCDIWKWIVAVFTPPIVMALFIIAAFTGVARAHKLTTGAPSPTSPPPAGR